jgi:uncharacterized protein YjiS (DUF1127 family)
LASVGAEGRSRRGWSLWDTALAVRRSILTLVRAWRERYRVRLQLAAMTERELHDVGSCQSDIANEIGKPFWRK